MNATRLPEALIDVHHRADEMHADRLAGTGAKDVSPELLAFLQHPRIGALVDRDDELGNGTQDFEELYFCGFHEPAAVSNLFWIDATAAERVKADREDTSSIALSRARTSAYLR